jgi:hypothetical protein
MSSASARRSISRSPNAGYRVSLVIGNRADHHSMIDGRETVPTLDAVLSAASAP